MRMAKFARFALAALSLAGFGIPARAQSTQQAQIRTPVMTASISPVQDKYYTGQKIVLNVELDFRDTDYYDGLRVGDLTAGDAVSIGEFVPLSANSANKMGYRADVVLLGQGKITLSMASAGTASVSESSGFFRTRRLFNFNTAATPIELNTIVPPLDVRPADYTGAVGDFKLEAKLSPELCYVGDILNLKWSLSGTGWAADATPPDYSPGKGFKVYPPRAILRSGDLASFEQVVIPLGTNVVTAAPLTMSTFNPTTGKYVRHSAPAFKLSVQPRPDGIETNSIGDLVVVPTTVAPSEIGTASGMGFMRLFRRSRGEPAKVTAGVSARLCPDGVSKVLFDIPAGTGVEIRESAGDWRRVLHGAAAGWVPAAVLSDE